MWYKVVRVQKSLCVSPVMAAGISDRLWSMEDVAALFEAADVKPGRRGGGEFTKSKMLLQSVIMGHFQFHWVVE